MGGTRWVTRRCCTPSSGGPLGALPPPEWSETRRATSTEQPPQVALRDGEPYTSWTRRVLRWRFTAFRARPTGDFPGPVWSGTRRATSTEPLPWRAQGAGGWVGLCLPSPRGGRGGFFPGGGGVRGLGRQPLRNRFRGGHRGLGNC